ncbi:MULTISPECIES: iron ABC transporter permease [unclassified Microbacterium]|uniref:ABC transporter permease n=1 Tax=unclassified Microbacterium TaxID=2609290 RepID=UPI0013844676|nr:ABC transporter permease subunit [Microbacterium sp. MAH-37]
MAATIDFERDRRASLRRSVTGAGGWTIFAAALTLVFVFPVTMIVIGAFRDGLPSDNLPFTLGGLIAAFQDEETWTTMWNSVVLVLVCGTISVAGGGLFAWIAANTNVPGRRLLTPLMAINLFVPPLFHTLGWIMLGNPQNGLLNQWARMLGATGSFMNIQTWGGLILLMSLGYMPFAYFLMLGAFKNRDQSLDEAAAISGAGAVRTFFTITLPSVGPAITGAAILVAVLVFQSFDSPQLIGRQAGIFVFSTQIYHYVRDQAPAEYTKAFALSLVLIILVLLLFLAQRWLLRGRSFTTLTGKTSRREPQELGPVRWVLAALVVLFVLLNLVLPLFAMILGSLQPIFGVMSTGLTFDNYVQMLTDQEFSSSLALTAWLAVIGGFGSIAIALLTAYVTARRSGFIRSYTSFAVWVPWALPGIVLALAYMFAVLYVPAFRGLYGSAFLMTLVLVVATIPVSSRIAEGALAQLSPELEEAARTSGAGSVRVLLSIVLRLVIPSFLAGWFLSALFISGNLAVPMLLAPPGLQPVSLTAFQEFLLGNMSQGAALFMIILVAAMSVLGLAALAMKFGPRVRGRSERATTVPLTRITP